MVHYQISVSNVTGGVGEDAWQAMFEFIDAGFQIKIVQRGGTRKTARVKLRGAIERAIIDLQQAATEVGC